jgi:LacI family transcriptional regulator
MSPLPGPEGAPNRATMKDVAALAGVSLKTVSRVVNGEGGVSSLLTERVERACRQLHFHPNLGARSLRRSDGRTATIGLVLEDIANPFSSAVHRAVEAVAVARDVAVLAGSLNENPQRERELIAAFSARRVDGLIIMPTGGDQSHLVGERLAGIPLVFVDRAPELLDVDVVLSDNFEGAKAATRHLLAAGHRRIGFLGDRTSIPTLRDRRAGFSRAMADAGILVPPDHVALDLGTMRAAEEATARMLAPADAPTALFTAQNLITIGAIHALRRLLRQRSVALVGFDDFLLADLLEPAVTVVAQDPHAIGTRAAELLFRRIGGDTSPCSHMVIPTRLIPRGSGELPAPVAPGAGPLPGVTG